MDKKILLETVKSWHIKRKPEYRGFRYAHCQKYMHKAWHIWFEDGGYKCEIHLCKNCYQKLSRPEKRSE